MSRIAKALSAYRRRHGLSWRALSQTLGYTSTYACDVARGRRLVSPSLAARYARRLGEDVDQWAQLALRDKNDALRRNKKGTPHDQENDRL